MEMNPKTLPSLRTWLLQSQSRGFCVGQRSSLTAKPKTFYLSLRIENLVKMNPETSLILKAWLSRPWGSHLSQMDYLGLGSALILKPKAFHPRF